MFVNRVPCQHSLGHLRLFVFLLCVLSVGLIGVSAIPALAQDQTLIYGQPITGEVTADTFTFRYMFDGVADEMIYLSAYVPDLTIVLTMQLYGPNGTPLAQTEDNVIGSLIGPYTLPSSGRYILELTQPAYQRGAFGMFELVVDRVTPTAIKPDGDYSGTLPRAGAVAFFAYTGPANELFGYAALGANLRFFMFAPDGNRIIYNQGETTVQEPLNVLTIGGTYTVILQTVNDGGTDYQLSLNPIQVITLEPNSPVSGQFSAAEPQVFRFTSAVDQLWNINLTAPDARYDNHLEIRSATDLSTILAYDQGGGADGASRLDPFSSFVAGNYYVLLLTENYRPDAVYTYTLTLAPSEVVRLENAVAYTNSVDFSTGTAVYLYFGIADERVRFTVETGKGGGLPRVTLYTPSDELADFSIRSQTRTSFEVILPETGLYRLVIRNIAFNEAAVLNYIVMAERVQG